MVDQRIERMAACIAEYSLGVKPGMLALLQTEPAGFPLAREVFRHALRLGAHPYTRTHYAELDEILFGAGSDEQVGYVSELTLFEIDRLDARLVIRAPDNLAALAAVTPERLALARRAQARVMEKLFARKARGELHVCLTQYPTDASAQQAGMSLADYAGFVFRACFCDRPEPVAAWRELSRTQQRHVDRLDRVQELRFESADTDLTLSVAGRKWVNSDGKANFPSGEVFTGPVEDSAHGHIRFDVPAIHSGRPVSGIEIEFVHGKVVKATAERGDELLASLLDTDAGSRLLGEVAFGLNYGIDRPTGNILFDEKIGGTVHLAVGSGYPETGSKNKSGLHWDMIKDMKQGRVHADGKAIYENGHFVAE